MELGLCGIQQPRHQQCRQHNAQPRAPVINPQQQAAVLRMPRTKAGRQQAASDKHQRTGHAGQQALQQQRLRIGKEAAEAHERAGQHSAPPQQGRRPDTAHEHGCRQRTQEVAQGVGRVHGAGQRVGPPQVGAHGRQKQAVGKAGDAQGDGGPQGQSQGQGPGLPHAGAAVGCQRGGNQASAPSCRRNWRTTWARRSACSRSDSAAAADCSTSAAFCWVAWSIWPTEALTWAMPLDCSAEAEVISPMMSPTRCTPTTISCMAAPASSTSFTPPFTALTLLPTSTLISCAASAERLARLRTSEATTAKPRPCPPARAASTAAFSARMLVWKAMESIRPMMSLILLLEAAISCMLPTAWVTTWPPRTASVEAEPDNSRATCADWAVCCTLVVRSDREVTVSCTLLADFSVRIDRSWLPEAISWLARATLSLALRTCETRALRPSCMAFWVRCRSATSSLPSTSTRWDRSPPAIAWASWRACSSGLQIEFMFRIVSGTTTSVATTSAAMNTHWMTLPTAFCSAMAPSASVLSATSSSLSCCSSLSTSTSAFWLMRLAVVADS